MARLLNLGPEGFHGCLFNMIFRDAFHDYIGAHTTNFNKYTGGSGNNKSFDNAYFTGGSKDSIQFSETVIKTLSTLIKKCPVKEEEEGKADQDDVMDEEGKADKKDCAYIDRVELEKAYNDIIIEIKANGVMSYFELDFIDGENKEIVKNSPFFQEYFRIYGKYEERKEQLEREIDQLEKIEQLEIKIQQLGQLHDKIAQNQEHGEIKANQLSELQDEIRKLYLEIESSRQKIDQDKTVLEKQQ